MDILDPRINDYLSELASVDDEPVLAEMEERAAQNGFPIVGRLCGQVLELLARSIGASRIFEMGSGYGYSAYWFSRAVGSDGEIHLTDMDPENEKLALDFLGRAGLDGPISYHVASATEAFDATTGEFDIVYCDIDKDGYPEAWDKAKERIRVGGMFICDNMLWDGRVAGVDEPPDGRRNDWAKIIDGVNRTITADPNFRSLIVPLRDGVIVALRVQ